MSESNNFSFNDGVICRNCKKAFSFAQSHSQTLHGVKFPHGDFSVIEANCPKCHLDRLYYPKDIVLKDRSNNQESEELKNLRNQLAQTTVERDTIKTLYQELLVKFAEIVHNSQQSQKPTDTQMQPVG